MGIAEDGTIADTTERAVWSKNDLYNGNPTRVAL
jgi:hypothetical protein